MKHRAEASAILRVSAFLFLMLGMMPFIDPANAAPSLPFDRLRDIYNYTFEFTADDAELASQPNMFAGIAAAFHEHNTAAPTGATKAKSLFSLQLVNTTAIATQLFVEDENRVIHEAAAIEATTSRFLNYLSNASALEAYRSANPSNTMDDYLLSIGADPNNNQDLKARAAMAGVPLGFAGGSTVSSVISTAVTKSLSLANFGLVTTNQDFLNDTHFINLRQGLVADFPVSLNIGFHRSDLRCTSFLMLHAPVALHFFHELTESLFASNGFPFYFVTRLQDSDYDDTEIAMGLARNPSCLLIVDQAPRVEILLKSLPFLTTHDLGLVHTVGFSYDYKPEFNADPNSAKNLYLTQITPHPDDTTSKFAVRASAALMQYFADVPDELYGNASEADCSVVNTSVTSQLPVAVGGVCRIIDYMKPSPFLEYQMMEGYAIGRLILDAAIATPGVVSTATIRETVFRQRMFLLEDFDLGPFTDQCSTGGVFPCFCTSGVRSMFTSRVNGTTGRSYAIYDRPELGEKNIATSTLSYSECQGAEVLPRRSINVVYLDLDASAAAVEGSSAQFPGYDVFSTSLSKALSQFSLYDFHASGSIYVVRRSLTLAEFRSTTTVASIVSEMSARYQPFVVATGFAVSESIANASKAVGNAGVIEMRGVGLRESSLDHSIYANEMTVDPSLAELVHGAASVAAQQGKSVLIIADTAAHGELAVLSLHTFGTQESAVVVSADGSRGGVDSHVSGGGVVLVASTTTATVQGVLEAVTGLSGSPTGSVYIAAPEACVYLGAVNAASTQSGNISVSVGFASGMRAWWSTTTSLGQRTSMIQYDDRMGGGSSSQTFISNPIHAKAMYYAWAIYAAAARAINIAASVGGAPTFPNTLYSARTIEVAGVQLGPYSNTTCATTEQLTSADRTCQCQNGVTEVYVHDLNSMIYGGATTGSAVQRIAGCTITYIPLPSTALDGTNLLIGVVAGVMAGLIALVAVAAVVYFCFFAGRNNRSAPKDESAPFTMAFTDIQSSTMLWARAPSSMAPAVDEHHRVLREVLSKHNGYEVKTIGDSFMIAFQHADDAVRFSAAAQRALYTATWAPGIDEVYRDITLEKLEEYQASKGANHSKTRSAAGAAASESSLLLPPDSSSLSGTSPPLSTLDISLGSPATIPGQRGLLVEVDTSNTNSPIIGFAAGSLGFGEEDPSENINKGQRGILDDLTERFYAIAHSQLLKDPSSYTESWCGVRVRIGVHTGMGSIKKDEVSGGYDYYGTVVNTAARVEGVGHGGQVLITDTTYEELRGTNVLSDCGCVALDLGDQPLRGLDAPVQLFQVNLSEFGNRAYLPLRLDVEHVLEENADEASQSESMKSAASNASIMSKRSNRVESAMYSRIEDYYDPDIYAQRVSQKMRLHHAQHNNSHPTITPSECDTSESAESTYNVEMVVGGTSSSQQQQEENAGVGEGVVGNGGIRNRSSPSPSSFDDSYVLLTTTLSTVPPAKAHDIIAQLAKTWRVRLSKEKRLLNMCKKRAVTNGVLSKGLYPRQFPSDVLNRFHVVELLQKVHPVAELNQRKRMKSTEGGVFGMPAAAAGGGITVTPTTKTLNKVSTPLSFISTPLSNSDAPPFT